MNIETAKIFEISNPSAFTQLALTVFKKQAADCAVYRDFIQYLGTDVEAVSALADIPFLPVSFFKTHAILSSSEPVQVTFSSSATTGVVQSKHQVTDLAIYEQSYLQAFEKFYGPVRNYCLLALLPSYQEREGSSLIYMVDDLIHKSGHASSGYFLHNNQALFEVLNRLRLAKQPTILIGVTYALLDLVEEFTLDFPELVVMETGGMKGKRKEMVREELHATLCAGFGVQKIHSEYGMTELLSQAYSKGDGVFDCPPWMKILIRDINDPISLVNAGKTGGINVIDLANVNSCSFISTQDLGRITGEGSFEVLGRFDNADIRGCNLLVQ